uniref:Microsomal glutathione S-transferase 2 n=1 Tax=Monodon monoceros TaxID=40151 RepID=A0A8C6F8N5_MONMO
MMCHMFNVRSSLLAGYFALQAGKARSKYKVTPPAVSGSPEFERLFHAQQNCVEFYPIFMITLWMFFDTCLSLVYIYVHHQYFWGYSEAAKEKVRNTQELITGFRLSLGVLALLTVLSTVGIANSFLDEYLDFNVAEKLRHF